ncbi:MAG: non-ribosomal peptide synthetase, partial [Tumebacillaceae bacterium]
MTGKHRSNDRARTQLVSSGRPIEQERSVETQLSYWREKLDHLPTLDLPHDHPRPPVPMHQGHKQSISLPASLAMSLQAIGEQQQATLFMTLLAAFQTVLYRYSGQEDIVLGTKWADVLVLRTDLSGKPTFHELLRRVRDVCEEAFANADVSLAEVVEALQAKTDPSRLPLCQVLFQMPEWSERDHTDESHAKASLADLLVNVFKTDDMLQVEFVYNEQIFEAATIERMLHHYVTLLQGVVDDPEQRVAELPMLTAEERQRLIFEFNDTVSEYPQACLHELFEEQVEKQPDALAVVFEETSLTYAELNKRSNQLAHHLRTLGIGPESVVGISVEKSPEMVVGLLGILKAGAAYAPLDPAYPKERLEFMLQDAQVPVLLTQERLLPDLPACDAQVICLDRDWAMIAEQSHANPQRLATPDHPSYVIYTSGTTGLPKGIVVLHRCVVNNIHDLNTRYAVGSSDRVIAISSLSFDMCVYEVFGMLMSGGCTVIPGEAELKDPVRWAELANRHGVTIWNSAPQLLEFLVSHLERQTSVPRPPIRLVLLGGDWVPVPLPDRLKALCPQARVIVMGGATEASIHSIIFEVEETDPEWTSIPYGVPMTNQTAYILDANLQVVPVGVAGELHLGGTGLTREYLRRPQLTAEKFIENPIPDGRSTRLYKTGDLAKYRPDGNIELLGRIDLQVKIRGLRIEVGEIEMTLKQRDDIQDAVVVALADKGAEKRLVAYIVPRHADALPSGVELRAYLAARLPNYMVPALFVHLEKLPLSPNGKVDRRSLPAPTANDILHDAAYTAPSNALEEMLVDIYADVLGVELVGIHDDFFALGGHSLLATQVLSRIREAIGSELTLRNLFDAPTVGALAPLVEMNREQGSRSETQLDTILPIPLEQRSQMPMSSAQQRLWFLSRYLPNHAAYNVPVLLTLEGQLDVKVLERSLNELVRRHEVLRTTYVEVNGEAMQVVTPAHHLDVATVDLAHVP